MTDYSRFPTLLTELDRGVLTVTMNRPDRLNAVGDGMHEAFEDLWEDVARDPEVRVVVLTGAGRAFCAGGDVRSGGQPRSGKDAALPGARRLIRNFLEVDQPIIAAINGDAVGLGATLALFCDVTIAAENARIGDTHVRAGLVAGDGGAVIWPLLVGVNRAKELLMTGRLISATEAERIGLINRVVPQGEAVAAAQELARELADGPSLAIRWTKASVNKLVRERMNLILDTSLAFEGMTMATEDSREAVSAFLEKRQPRFVGR